MTILCADGLTEAKIINSSKFATDTIIANMNICVVALLLSLVSVYFILFYFFWVYIVKKMNESIHFTIL
jgi:hypothetical protein